MNMMTSNLINVTMKNNLLQKRLEEADTVRKQLEKKRDENEDLLHDTIDNLNRENSDLKKRCRELEYETSQARQRRRIDQSNITYVQLHPMQ